MESFSFVSVLRPCLLFVRPDDELCLSFLSGRQPKLLIKAKVNQSSEVVTHVLFYTSFILCLFHFLQQPTEGTSKVGKFLKKLWCCVGGNITG